MTVRILVGHVLDRLLRDRRRQRSALRRAAASKKGRDGPAIAAMARRRIERDAGFFAKVEQVKDETVASNRKNSGSEAA